MREREALKRYLDELESADAQDEVVIDPSAVAAALEKLKQALGTGSWSYAHG